MGGSDWPMPAARPIAGPVPSGATAAGGGRRTVAGWRSLPGRFGFRLVAGMLAVSLPIMVILAVTLTVQESSSLTATARRTGGTVARAVSL
jgi:hypothetical protein